MFDYLNTSIYMSIHDFAGVYYWLDTTGVLIAEYTPYVFISILLWMWFFSDNKKNSLLLTGYSVLIGLGIDAVISALYFHPRPFMDVLGVLLIQHLPDSSFPSDHTTFMLAISFMFLTFKETRVIGILLSVVGLLSGFSRVFVGVHYPYDIFGSVIVAGLSVCVVSYISKYSIVRSINAYIITAYTMIIKKIRRHII